MLVKPKLKIQNQNKIKCEKKPILFDSKGIMTMMACYLTLSVLLVAALCYSRAEETGTCTAADMQSGGCADVQLPAEVDGYVDLGYGEQQKIEGVREQAAATRQRISAMHAYMQSVYANETLKTVAKECQNRNELCGEF